MPALWVFRLPEVTDPTQEWRARMSMRIVRAIGLAVITVMVLSLFDPRNQVTITLALYLPVLALITSGAALLHRGYLDTVGWGLALLVWAVVTVALVLFGGLVSHNGFSFVVAMTIAGTLVGGRAALVVGTLSVASSVVTFVLDQRGLLPTSLAPTSGVNSLVAIAVSMATSGWLLSQSLKNLQRALDAERKAARERDLAHAKALQSQRLEAVGRLAAGVAHDLNNVLSVIGLASEEVRGATKGNPALQDVSEDLAHAVDTAALLSRRMVGMSRTADVQTETLELGKVVDEFAPLLRRLLPEQSTLTVQHHRPRTLTASRSAIEHILLNLVMNAREAMPAGGAITVAIDDAGFSVRDEGVGISPEVQAKLFTPFFTTRATGTGLGLANVAELAKSMGAVVQVDSTPGKGSTFRVVFGAPSA